ncbi:TetR/AcrR family transcriptional regulator [Deinococcus sp.]|uniref:TetR/AcrR family transcriptional regulator n=1 Tax=Deinococcus sp. TaxID=47478 RepID=UPI003B5A5FAE
MTDVVLARRLSAQTRREQILEVAARLFIERGFEAVGMADIAAELRVSRPTIYSYFPSTEMMLESLFEAKLERFPERLSPLLPESGVVPYGALFELLLQEHELLSLLNSGGGPPFRRHRRAFLQAIESRLNLYELPAVRREPHLLPIILNLLTSLAYERISAGTQDEGDLPEVLSRFIVAGIAGTKGT